MPLKTYLTRDEIERMIDAAPTLRDKLIIQFLFRSGCRVSELTSIRVEDIDWDRRQVLIHHLKRSSIKKECPNCGKKSGRTATYCPSCGESIEHVVADTGKPAKRIIHVDSDTLSIARQYVDERQTESDRLVPLTRQAAYYIITDVADRAGLGGDILTHPDSGKKHRVSPHKMRDAHALEWIRRSGSDVSAQRKLQQQLGHKSFGTTTRYLKFDDREVGETYDKIWEE